MQVLFLDESDFEVQGEWSQFVCRSDGEPIRPGQIKQYAQHPENMTIMTEKAEKLIEGNMNNHGGVKGSFKSFTNNVGQVFIENAKSSEIIESFCNRSENQGVLYQSEIKEMLNIVTANIMDQFDDFVKNGSG